MNSHIAGTTRNNEDCEHEDLLKMYWAHDLYECQGCDKTVIIKDEDFE